MDSDTNANNQIELITDGEGLAVIGDARAVEAFLAQQGLVAKDMDLPRLSRVMGTGAAGTQAASQYFEQVGRWVKLTPKSARDLKQYELMKGSADGVRRTVLTQNGKSKGFLEIVRGRGTNATSPAMLSGAAGLMTQLALQSAMSEVTEYLERIDAKVEDVLRAQKDAVIANMAGVAFDIDEATKLHEHVGRVNEVMWSKVQSASSTIARTQSYALLQLEALAAKLEDKARISTILDAAREVENHSQEWLAVLARCFQLQDSIAILEIDRVMETSPEDLDGHRLGLWAARADRLVAISRVTESLLERIATASDAANLKVLFNPSQSPSVVRANAHSAGLINEFHDLLGVGSGLEALEARLWREAAADTGTKARAAAAAGLARAKRKGVAARGKAAELRDRMPEGLTSRWERGRADGDDQDN